MAVNFNFEWNSAKAALNLSKHGVSFERAATVFRDARQISIYDEEHDDEEERWATIGMDNIGNLLVVIHTFRMASDDDIRIRIISARKATRRETRQYSDTGDRHT